MGYSWPCPAKREETCIKSLTPRLSRAHLLVTRVRGIATGVAHAGIVQALVAKVLAVEVLDAPEAAGADGGLLGTLGDVGARRAAAAVSGDAHGGRHGAEEALDERGHGKGHQDECEGEGEQRRLQGDAVVVFVDFVVVVATARGSDGVFRTGRWRRRC